MWVKLCGIVRPQDLARAVEVGADAAGVIAVPDSPRCVSEKEALALAGVPRGKTKLVLVMRDPRGPYMEEMIDVLQPDMLQFHGFESPPMAASSGIPYIKAVRNANFESAWHLRKHKDAYAWLLDVPKLNLENSGFIANLSSMHSEHRLIIAGGLQPDTVGEVPRALPVWGVDVSRGVERTAREKDHELMRRFVEAVREVHA